MPLHIALYQPEIPPNTGNIQRLCANIGAQLHLIRPLGFQLNNRRSKRAGMDYISQLDMQIHDSYEHFKSEMAQQFNTHRIFALTTRGERMHVTPEFANNDVFLFGPETRGLPDEVLADVAQHNWLRLPMQPDSRSLNLSNAAAVMAYEAWRQLSFATALT
jgi:tRNA (cytidine/uridine-2'-O-)-methyltransferase